MKKKIILLLILTHVACIWIGYKIGNQRINKEEVSLIEDKNELFSVENQTEVTSESQVSVNTGTEINETMELENKETENAELEDDQNIEEFPEKTYTETMKPTPTESSNKNPPNTGDEFGLGEEEF